jgi:3-deoxy-manno-octulosonate cytidylyltransferase (CMP-KDO synthetase)
MLDGLFLFRVQFTHGAPVYRNASFFSAMHDILVPMKPLIVIPARMGSTRFPGKPLAFIHGKAMLQRVWEIASQVKGASLLIATDHEEIRRFAEKLGAPVLMTSSSCLTGTDRVAEVARQIDAPIYFSLQGDAPLTPPWVIQEVLTAMQNDPSIQMATPAVRLQGDALDAFVQSKKEGSSTGTSVVFDHKHNALYFSKALLRPVYRHIGLYAYRKETLLRLNTLPEGPFEKAEKLEQLRALENGIPIRVVEVDYRGRTHGSVDRPEDIAVIEALIAQEGELIPS